MKNPFRRGPRPDDRHTVIIGAGEVGFHVAGRLVAEGRQVTVVDKDVESLKRVAEALDVQIVQGSGCSPATLANAAAGQADLILAVTNSDEDNLIACFFASQMAPGATRLARIRNEEYTRHFEAHPGGTLNINMLINPSMELVLAIVHILSVPGAVDFREFADRRLKLIGLRLQDGPLIGKPLTNFPIIMDQPNVRVAAVIRKERLIIPQGSDTLEVDDIVYFACTEEAVPAVRRTAHPSVEGTRNVLVVGGGSIGLMLAQHLEERGYHIKLLDKSLERCAVLAETLKSTIILHGNGTYEEVLREENAGAMDAVIALTGNEESNMLICLLARSLGANRLITRVNNAAYMPLARALGISHCVSPRLAAVNSIIKYLRRGNVLSAFPIKDDEAQVLELLVPEGAPVTSGRLAEGVMPRGAGVLAVLRGENLFIPKGDTRILPGDRITVFAHKNALSAMEEALSGRPAAAPSAPSAPHRQEDA